MSMEEGTTDFKRALMVFPAGEWDSNLPYAIEDGDLTPMVELDGRRYVLRDTEEAVTGIAPNSEEGLKYWNEVDIQPRFEGWATLLKYFSRKMRKIITRSTVRHNRFIRQIAVLHRNERHYRVIRRCLWYGDRVPRKYRRAYGEVIRSLAGMENLREVLGRPKA